MECEERYTEIFAYLRRFEQGYLVGGDVVAKLKEFIDTEEKAYESLSLKYRNKFNNLKGCYQRLVDDIKIEESK